MSNMSEFPKIANTANDLYIHNQHRLTVYQNLLLILKNPNLTDEITSIISEINEINEKVKDICTLLRLEQEFLYSQPEIYKIAICYNNKLNQFLDLISSKFDYLDSVIEEQNRCESYRAGFYIKKLAFMAIKSLSHLNPYAN